jgi:GT2 family glycosyltransferase
LSPASDNARHRHERDRHVVTAVLVAHDGGRWLPSTLKALLSQTRPVQRLVAADTGSADRGPAVLAEVIGHGNLVILPRTTGFGEAVGEALRHPAATMEVPETADLPVDDRIEWIWLLHDDSAPAPTALQHLLAVAEDNPHVGILGPKLRDWYDQRMLLELGVTMDAAGRRDTGIDRREFDQGQHDGVKDVLAVSTAGMLIRRDVWTELGGFDVRLGLFRDDIDLGWRAHAAGHRVFAVSDAVVYHAEAAARRQRAIGMTSDDPRRVDRRNALYVLLANVPFRAMLRMIVRNIVVSLVRAIARLVMKKPDAARQELAGLRDVLRHPSALRRMRADRAEGRMHAYRHIRRFLSRGLALRRLVDVIGNMVSGTGPVSSAGRHHSFGDDGEDEEPLVPETRWLSKVLAHPGVVTVLLLTAVTIGAGRELIASGGRLGGGALVPAWGGAHDLWAQYLSGWHPVGLGSATGAPPAVGLLAVLSTILLGKPWLAVMALLLGCVPLAGLTAYLAAKRVVPDVPPGEAGARRRRRVHIPTPVVRSWAALTYAMLPVATGAVTAGRIGTAVVVVLLPLICLQALHVVNPPGPDRMRRAGRAAWATALLLAIAMAFMPLTWVLVAAAGVMVWVAYGPSVPALRRHLAIALGVPLLLLLPWVAALVPHPSRFLLEIGLNRPELVDARLPALSVLALNPGGPGTPALWVTGGLIVLGLCALPLRGERTAVLGGWMLALFGLLVAVLAGAATVTKGADAAPAWPGVPLAFAAGGVLVAAVVGVRRAVDAFAGRRLPARLAAIVLLGVALSTPALAAVNWGVTGGRGPLTAVDRDAIPAFVQSTADAAVRPRMLVLRHEPAGEVTYSVLRGAMPALGESEILTTEAADRRMDALVAGLLAGRGADESRGLTRMGIHYVLVPNPGRDPITGVLDSAPEVIRLSRTERFALWRLATPGGRLMLLDGDQITPLTANPVTARVRIPPGPAHRTVLLAEPADGGWHAALDGAALHAKTADGWAQSWEVSPAGGQFTLTRGMLIRHIWLGLQAAALLVVIALALPGGRAEETGPETGSKTGSRTGPRTWRDRARRRGAAGPAPADEPVPVDAEADSTIRVAVGVPPGAGQGAVPDPMPDPMSDPGPDLAAEPVPLPAPVPAPPWADDAPGTGDPAARAPLDGEPAAGEPGPAPGQRRRGRGVRRRPARGIRILRGLRRSTRRRPGDETGDQTGDDPGDAASGEPDQPISTEAYYR